MEITEEYKKKFDVKEYRKKYRAENSEYIKAQQKLYEIENSESIKAYKKKYRAEHVEYFKNYRKKYRAENYKSLNAKDKKYREENPEYFKEYKKKYARNRLKNDPIFKMVHNMRRRLLHFFKSSNIKKNNKTFDMVGCTPEFLLEHLASQFKEGMTYENYGLKGWVIDHIIPLSSAGNDIEKLEKLCHYTNLQPLWWWENLSKGDKIS